MKVCDQFTDERIARFVPIANNEMEVHSSVDLRNTPSAVPLGIAHPVAIIDDGENKRGERPYRGLRDRVALKQGNILRGVVSFPQVHGTGSYANRFDDEIYEKEVEEVVGDTDLSKSLEGITHAIVTFDYMQGPRNTSKILQRAGSPFAEHDAAVIPIDEPIPYISEEFKNYRPFFVSGFVNDKMEQVVWRNQGNVGANWLVDLCVMNAYTANNVELALLRHSIGFGAVLNGLVSVQPETGAYLRHFDAEYHSDNVRTHGGMTFFPSTEPTARGYEKKFPKLTDREIRIADKLIELSNKGMTLPRVKITW